MLVIILLASPVLAADPRTTLDIPYGPDRLQTLDVYRPAADAPPRPAVLWLHGGGWTDGDKRTGPNGIASFAAALVDRGFVAVAVNYRLLPRHRYPAQLDDAQLAVRWLREHAAEHGVDPARIGAVGISAGGHLAALLAVRDTRDPEAPLAARSSRVQAAVAINPVTDLRPDGPDTPLLRQVFRAFAGNDPTRLAEASPITFASKTAAPLLFIYGDKDPLVPNDHSRRMAAALDAAGAPVQSLAILEGGHGLFPSTTPAVRDAALDFLTDRLRPQ